jgi:hypothetical protein
MTRQWGHDFAAMRVTLYRIGLPMENHQNPIIYQQFSYLGAPTHHSTFRRIRGLFMDFITIIGSFFDLPVFFSTWSMSTYLKIARELGNRDVSKCFS